MAKGYLALVLHGHLPFVRHPEHEDSFEESWLYQAITEVYVPLLLVLDSLADDAVDFRLTFSLTPTLVSMLTDPFLQSRYLRRLERLIELAEKKVARTNWQPEFQTLAAMYCEQFKRVRSAFLDRYNRNLVAAFGKLQEQGKLEIIASAATHGYLPLLSVRPSAVQSQIQVGGIRLPGLIAFPQIIFDLLASRQGNLNRNDRQGHGNASGNQQMNRNFSPGRRLGTKLTLPLGAHPPGRLSVPESAQTSSIAFHPTTVEGRAPIHHATVAERSRRRRRESVLPPRT